MPTPPTNCLECNSPLNAAESQGLCARCLLKLGFASQFGQPSISAAGQRMPVPPPLLPFDFGGYRVLQLLGRGGMGAVYEAEHLESGRRVALKVLGQSIDSEETRKRFLREGRLAASVSHPNSVYVYGTEEIDGAPVIAMELAAGGTLRDLIKRRGPLPPREAVDIILQVIAGLETAHEAGVLHRDVKPANCFVTPDGSVKVGDFGLSVSTLARSDSQLTASGVMLGTPSYAPPEQLRADELDVRADIYSVGATLYALLTGRAPFEGDNAVQVVAAVLDKQPALISRSRNDVPVGLSQVVMRCLEKRRENRFSTYAELREALIPFSTEAPQPAPIGLRIVAGIIDGIVVLLPYLVYASAFGKDMVSDWLVFRDARTLALMLSYASVAIFYYAVTEGIWGAGLGKMLLGLRVARPGLGVPGFIRAAARALMISMPEMLGYIAQYFLTDAETFRAQVDAGQPTISDTTWILYIALFVTMRQRNGFAAIHDLLTGTRVVLKPKSLARPRLQVHAPPIATESPRRVGPYLVPENLGSMEWVTGYDDQLRRPAWIHRVSAGAPAVSDVRRGVSRSGRVRWLAGSRETDGGWDAYEAPAGCHLVLLSTHSKSWSAVRHWLADLTSEIEAALEDGTLPKKLSLDHVFVTTDGRAVLLDEPMRQGADTPPITYNVSDIAGLQQFLDAVADYALDRGSLPLHARDFLERLKRQVFDRATFIAGNLHSLLSKPPEITRRRRLASLLLAPAICLVASVVAAAGVY
ncbi:MAG TPA: protein kinase, partial [Chthoniobacteraceae bacterium]|nr:protein kinase [Chthoniobacteraceae bacterium]